jgi:endoglucanase
MKNIWDRSRYGLQSLYDRKVFMKVPAGLGLGLLLLCSCVTTPTQEEKLAGSVRPSAHELSFLHAQDRLIVDEQGQTVALRGCNAGSWLLIEPWMLGVDVPAELQSEKDLWDLMGKRFGEEEKLNLIRTFRKNFFTEADVQRIADLGMNCLRIPLWWRSIDDPNYAGDIAWLDDCLTWCRKAGIYAIIDLHGAPGGQTKNGVIVGERTDAALWKDKKFQDQTVEWWKRIATRYKDDPVVAAYDLLNEAIDGPINDLMALNDRLYREVRKIDAKHMIIIEDGLYGFHRLPHPRQMGWENVVYSFHYYPQSPDEGVGADATIFQKFNRAALYYGVPVYVGEFNTLKIQRGGVDSQLRYMQAFDFFDWAWTFWSYKKMEDNWDYNWGLYGYDRHPRIRFQTDSAETIRQAFEKMRTEETGVQPFFPAAFQQPPRFSAVPSDLPEKAIFLAIKDAFLFPEGGKDLRMEWGGAWPSASYWGKFDRLAWPVEMDADGKYELNLMLANAAPNVGVQVWLDGVLLFTGRIEQPTGDWNRFEPRSIGTLDLSKGRHLLEIASAKDADSFMNLRYGFLTPTATENTPRDESKIRLFAANMNPLPAGCPIRVEWLNDPTSIGYWLPNEKVTWSAKLTKARDYRVSMTYATPNTNTVCTMFVDGAKTLEATLPCTKSWGAYETIAVGNLSIPAGAHEIMVQWQGSNPEGCGNLAEIMMR